MFSFNLLSNSEAGNVLFFLVNFRYEVSLLTGVLFQFSLLFVVNLTPTFITSIQTCSGHCCRIAH